MVLPLLPAHPLLLITADLRTSRVLYLSAPGLAMLLAQVLAGIPSIRVRRLAAVLLVCLFSAGTLHNLRAWRSASQLEKRFLTDIKRLEPNPPPHAEFVFHDMPTEVRGIGFHVAGLQDAIRMTLGRDDVIARRAVDPSGQEEHRPKRPEIHIMWIGTEATLIELLNTAFAYPPKTKEGLAGVPSPYMTIYSDSFATDSPKTSPPDRTSSMGEISVSRRLCACSARRFSVTLPVRISLRPSAIASSSFAVSASSG
jgi:hypothetical protein